MANTLGQRIRELREAKDLSLREFGKKLGGRSAAFLSDIELGRRHPSDEVLVEMARVLGVSVEELRKHDSRPPVDELRRLAASDPAYGLAFRRVIEQGMSPDELLQFVREREEKLKDQK